MKDIKFNLHYAENMCCFEQTINIDGSNIWFAVIDLPQNETEKANREITKIWQWVIDNLDKIKNYIAHSDLLKMKNEGWLEEDEEPLTVQDFVERISAITSVSAYYENGFSVCFEDDNDIFWGHEIQVMVNKSFEFEKAEMVG